MILENVYYLTNDYIKQIKQVANLEALPKDLKESFKFFSELDLEKLVDEQI